MSELTEWVPFLQSRHTRSLVLLQGTAVYMPLLFAQLAHVAQLPPVNEGLGWNLPFGHVVHCASLLSSQSWDTKLPGLQLEHAVHVVPKYLLLDW